MELTPIPIPEIPLPFEISVLMHPAVIHFIIALPIFVLLLELVNLVAKKRAIGITSFALLFLTVLAAGVAYLTGITDGKEAYDLLSQAGQLELKEHKILGTYLMLASVIVLVFKMLSALIRRGLMKILFMLVLIFFVAGILKQGHDGGELVYKYGANVERVSDLDSELFDAKEALEEAEEASKSAMTKASEALKEKTEELKADMNETAQKVSEAVSETVTAAKEKAVEAKAAVDAKVEELSTPSAPVVEAPAASTDAPAVEVVPAPEEPKPEVATH